MERSKEHSIEAQVRALVDIFIAGVTPKEALTTLEEGPSALWSLCFRWAFEASALVQRDAEHDAVSSAGLHEMAPIVNQLRDGAILAFIERYGEPREPLSPVRPEGLQASIRTEQDPGNHRRMSRAARPLGQTVIYGGSGAWQTVFHITRNRDRSEFVLWITWDDDQSDGTYTTRAGWLDAVKGLSEHDAALFLFEDYWSAMRDEWQFDRPNELSAYGETLTQDELNLVADRVWPND